MEEYTKQLTVIDMGLLKACSCAVGVAAGVAIPKKKKKCALAAALVVFSLSAVPLMYRVVKAIADSR